jgi:hypothetical protein
MSQEVKLGLGDSAVIIRHEDDDNGGFGIEIYHHPADSMSEDDVVFYTLLTRGMAYHATQDMETVLDMGRQSFEDEDITITQH